MLLKEQQHYVTNHVIEIITFYFEMPKDMFYKFKAFKNLIQQTSWYFFGM